MTTAMPVLETARLLIRPVVVDDFDAACHILDAGFGTTPADERRVWLEWAVRNHSALANLFQPPYGDRAFILKETNAMIGMVGLVPAIGPYRRLPAMRYAGEPEDRFIQPEFGLFWATAPEQQRKGYAAEAAQGMIDYAFKTMNIRRIIAETDTDNLASQAVMRRLGMTINHNPTPGDPPWFQVVGVLYNPSISSKS
ncbi:MAG: GNAT family N-acetyltransferase [Anaerolineae bacterium]